VQAAVKPTDTMFRILDAAEACMARYGLRVSMADVAAEAGVSRGTVYNAFGDRAAVADAVLARTADRFVAASAPVVDRRRTLAGQVGEAAVFITSHLDDAALTIRLPGERYSLLATLLTARIETLVDRWVAFWQPKLRAAEQRGEIRAGLDLRRAGEWIVRLLLSFAVMPSVAIDLSDPDAVRAFVKDHLVRGLC
jgi:AcrR family transcriptional regulator